MDGDAAFRECAASLWALLGAMRRGSPSQQDAAADRALSALERARGAEHFLILHEADGSLHVNGRRLPYDLDAFAATNGLVQRFRDHGVGEVLFDADCDRARLSSFARCFAGPSPAADLAAAGGGAIHVGCREPGAARPLPMRQRAVAPQNGDSGLGAMFLVHGFVAALGALPYVSPRACRLTVGAIVDCLLTRTPRGPESLAVLQCDDAAVRAGLEVAIYATLAARAAGWPEEGLAELGCAAFLHRIGDLLDAEHPATAGFHWLLAHGSEGVWLRSAIVQRLWRTDHGRDLAAAPADGDLGAAIVRFAVTAAAVLRSGSDLEAAQHRLEAASARGHFPVELVHAACGMLAAVAKD